MGIRVKIMSGFLILATMLLVAGAWSIYELKNIGISAQNILNENYRSIDAAKVMTEALEREDSAILLLLLGERDEGLAIMRVADEAFGKAYVTALTNITIPGEQDYVNAVTKSYGAYRDLWLQFMASSTFQGDLAWYFREVNPTFLKAKTAVSDLMNLNNQVMYQTASQVESRAHRATMPGIIAIAAAFIFALIFSFLINLYVINPIVQLTSGIRDYLDRGKPLNVRVESEDEISRLVSSVEQLIKKSNP
jgi:HAMP domain-containing protein